MIAIGIGCRKGCEADEIVALVGRAMDALQNPHAEERRRARLRPPRHQAAGLFTIVGKRGEVGLEAAARQLGLPLVFLEADALRRPAGGATTVSPRIQALHGLPSVAETAALAGAGDDCVLLVARMSTPRATCAIAGPRP